MQSIIIWKKVYKKRRENSLFFRLVLNFHSHGTSRIFDATYCLQIRYMKKITCVFFGYYWNYVACHATGFLHTNRLSIFANVTFAIEISTTKIEIQQLNRRIEIGKVAKGCVRIEKSTRLNLKPRRIDCGNL